ncbi:MAG: type II secretion system protein N [Burkholderiaceae bacterium]
MKKLAAVLVHVVMLAVVCVIAAYWAIRIVTPQPAAAPPPLAAPPPRDPDPVLAARMFGLVQVAPTTVLANVQVAGVFAAGADSSAVLVVDGKPARAYLLGQELAPGTRLVEVRADGVTLEGAGGRQDLKVPARQVASFSGTPPPPAYRLSGNTLSAPNQFGAPVAPTAAPQMPPQGAPAAVAEPPGMPRPPGGGPAVSN